MPGLIFKATLWLPMSRARAKTEEANSCACLPLNTISVFLATFNKLLIIWLPVYVSSRHANPAPRNEVKLIAHFQRVLILINRRMLAFRHIVRSFQQEAQCAFRCLTNAFRLLGRGKSVFLTLLT